MTRRSILLVALFFLLAPIVGWAQDTVVDPTGALNFDWSQPTTIGALVGGAIFLTHLAKERFANARGLKNVPAFVYVILFTETLTIAANQFFGTLPGEPKQLVFKAFLIAGMASGFREWVYNGMKPIKEAGKIIVILLALGGTLAGCAGKRVVLPPAPAVLLQNADQDVKAVAIKALEIIEATNNLLGAVVDIELAVVPSMPEPARSRFHEPFKRIGIAIAEQSLVAIDLIEKGAVTEWSALKRLLDPIIAGVQSLVDLSRTLPNSVASRSGFRTLIQTLGQLIGSVGLPALREPIPTGAQ